MFTFVTGNAHKAEEFRKIIGDKFPFQTKDLDLPEFQGDPVEIAREKCKIAAQSIDEPVVVEDVSLCFDALGGLPGPYVKWFLKAIGPEGLVKLLDGFPDNKTAYAQCIYAFSLGKGCEPEIFQGITHGLIVSPRTEARFGWDSIFQPIDGGGCKTYEEMSKDEKCAISHRSKALEKLISRLKQLSLDGGIQNNNL